MISKYDGDEDPVPLPSNYTIHNAGHIGLIHNEGTIEHIDGGETILNSHGGTIDQIINDGTISSQRDGHSYDAITNFGTITNGIVNRGLIDGSVDLGDATLYLEGSSGRVTGGIYGNAAVVVNGTFTQENEIRTSHLEINSGGTLTLANHADIASFFNDGKSLTAVVENKGRVIVNANTEAQIDNDYHQHAGATLEIGATSAAQYGRLRVTGDATFDADTGLHVNVSQVNTLANDNALSGMVSAGGNLNATTFNVTDNSYLFDFEAAVNGNDIDLKTIATSNSGIHDSIASASFSQGAGAARVLDGFVTGGTTGDMANIVTALGQLGSAQEVSNAVAQTLPLMSASINQVTANSMRTTNRVIQARQEGNIGRSSGEGFLGDKHFWFKPIAAKANQNNRKGVAGYDADTYGFIIGADAEVNDSNRLGLAFSYMNSDVDGKSSARSNRADIDAYQVIAYGSHTLASNPAVEINWQADVGINKNDGRRSITFGGLNRVAKSDFDSTTAHVGAGISRGIQLSERTSFILSVRADYFWIRNESYTEKGADALNLKVKGDNTEQLIAMMEGHLQHRMTDRAALTANLGIGYDLFDQKNSIASSYVGGGASFRTQGLELSPWIGRAGIGLTVNATERTEITARYDVEGRSDFVGQAASLKVRWAF